jgi:hypothetical protein
MPVISTCIEPGCSTLCIGLFCVVHDATPQVMYTRGRPWPPASAAEPAEPISPVRASVPEPVLSAAVRPAA